MAIERIRSTGGISPLSLQFKHTINCQPPAVSYLNRGKNGFSKVTHDWVTPGYARAIASGAILCHPFRTDEYEYSTQMGTSIHRHPGTCPDIYEIEKYFNFVKGSAECSPVLSPEDVRALQVQVATAAAAKVAAPDWQGLVFLAELEKTVSLLSNPLRNFNNFLNSLRRSPAFDKHAKRSGTSSLASFLRDQWLEVRFGFRPLMYDVSDVVDAIGRLNSDRPPRHTARSASSLVDSSQTNYVYSDSTFNINYQVVLKDKVTVRAGVLYDYSLSDVDAFGLSLTQMPSTFWELMPYSFVADWFVNVADYIAALTAQASTNHLAEWLVTVREQSALRTITSSSLTASAVSAGWVADALPSGSDSARFKSIARETVLPVGLTYKPGSLFKVASSARIVDAIALLTQLLRRS